MATLEMLNWDLLALAAFCIINLGFVTRCYSKLRYQRGKLHSQKRRIRELEDDVQALYESASTLGNQIQLLEQSNRVLKEQQEQLSLKEPNQQTYRNAIAAIHNGESINDVATSSGLSRGEVELLNLLQSINNSKENTMPSFIGNNK